MYINFNKLFSIKSGEVLSGIEDSKAKKRFQRFFEYRIVNSQFVSFMG